MAAESVGQIGLDLVINQNQFKRQMSGVQNLAKKAGIALASAFAVKKLVDFGKQCVELGSDLEEVQNVVDVTFPRMNAQVDKFAKSAAGSFGLSETMAKKYTGTYGAMAKAFGFTEQAAYDMSTTLTSLAGDVASFYNISQDQAYTKLKSVFSGETETLKELGIVMTQSALDQYALANGYNKTTKAMSEAEKVALRYAFVQSQLSAASGDFARTSDSWANQTRYLKLQLESLKATLGQGLINVFKPLLKNINVIIGKFNEFAQVITNALGGIFGWKKESNGGISESMGDAELSSGNVSDNLDNANDNAKKLQRTLMGFDSINKLADVTKSSESSGNGGTSGGNTSGNEWVKTDGIVEKFKSEIKSLEELGEYINQSLIKAMNRINWDSVYEKAENFGTGFAEFLNGLISPELFSELGRTLASSLNTVFYSLNGFAETFDWRELGTSITSGITSFFKNWDAGLAAETFSNFASGLMDTLTSALWAMVDQKTFKAFGDKVVEFICGIDWGQLAWDLGGLLLALAGALLDAPGQLFDAIAEPICNNICEAVEKVDWDALAQSIVKKIEELKLAWKDFTAKFKIDVPTKVEDIKEWWNNRVAKWKDKTASFRAKAATTVSKVKEWYNNRKNVWKDKTASFKAKVSGKSADIKKKWNKLTGSIKDKVVTITAKLKDNISAAIKSMWNGIAKGINKAIDTINKIPGVNIGKLPYLAQGGYVKRNTPQLAVIGDNTRYGEIVAPEDKLLAMARQAAAMSGGGNSAELITLLREILLAIQTLNLVATVDVNSLKQLIVQLINDNTKATGMCEINI